jgi:hypothetical protein
MGVVPTPTLSTTVEKERAAPPAFLARPTSYGEGLYRRIFEEAPDIALDGFELRGGSS